MLGSLFFALFLYRAKLSVLRIFFCKLSINLLINVGLGSLWSAILYGKGYLFYLARSLGKNLLLLVPEVVLIVLFFRMTLPILEATGLAVKQPQGVIPLVGLGGKARVPYTKPVSYTHLRSFPIMMLSKVVLPALFGPSTATFSPLRRVRSNSRNRGFSG